MSMTIKSNEAINLLYELRAMLFANENAGQLPQFYKIAEKLIYSADTDDLLKSWTQFRSKTDGIMACAYNLNYQLQKGRLIPNEKYNDDEEEPEFLLEHDGFGQLNVSDLILYKLGKIITKKYQG